MITKLPLLLGLMIFSANCQSQTYQQQYKDCSHTLQEMKNVDSLYFETVKRRDSCLIGSNAPDFKATTIHGKKIALSELKGNIVVLNFWFTKCQPCIGEMPELNKIVTHYSGKKVTFLSFAPEDKTVLRSFLSKHPFSFAVVAESENIRRDIFGLFSAWPYSIIIDQSGKINKMWFGAIGDIELNYTKTIDGLLNQ